MALSLESAGRVRQKTRALTLDPSIYLALKGFFTYWATNKQNADLQLVPVADASVTGSTGQVIADAAATVYVVYVKKGATATDSYLKLFDSATTDAVTTEQRLSVGMLEANEEQFVMYPKGLTMGTGVIAAAHTTSEGATQSTAGDAGNGFIILGASGQN